MSKHLEALNAAKSSLDFFGNKSPKCPHCGSDFDIHNNEAWYLYEADSGHSVDCQMCGREFEVITRCNYSFDTDEQDHLDEDSPEASTVAPHKCGGG